MIDEPHASTGSEPNRRAKSPDAFRTISEVSAELDVAQHVLRFWETKFSQIRPLKRAGRRRYYRPEDVALLRRIRGLLYDQGYTIRGVQKLIREKGTRAVIEGETDVALASESPRESEPVAPEPEAESVPERKPELEADSGHTLQGLVHELAEIRDQLRRLAN